MMTIKQVWTVAIIVAACPQMTSADLSLLGGGASQRALVLKAYSHDIPLQFHTHCNIPVQLLDDTTMDRYLIEGEPGQTPSQDDLESIDGVYEDGPPLITLRSSCANGELEYTIAHEYGHFVWNTELTDQQRSAYNKIYKTQKSKGLLISDYAGYSVIEGFAEAFATFSDYPTLLKSKDSLSYSFLIALRLQSTSSTNASMASAEFHAHP